jgi:hypothetical protein
MVRVSADDQRRAPTPAAELTLKDVTASTVANIAGSSEGSVVERTRA